MDTKRGIGKPNTDRVDATIYSIAAVVDEYARCANCHVYRSPRAPSPYFCSEECQTAWTQKVNRIPLTSAMADGGCIPAQVQLPGMRTPIVLSDPSAAAVLREYTRRLRESRFTNHDSCRASYHTPCLPQPEVGLIRGGGTYLRTAADHIHISFDPARIPSSRNPLKRAWRTVRAWVRAHERRRWFKTPPTSS